MADPRFERLAEELRTWLRQQEESGEQRIFVDWEHVARIREEGQARRAAAQLESAGSAAEASASSGVSPAPGSEAPVESLIGGIEASGAPPLVLSREEKTAALSALKEEVSGCVQCKLHPTRTQTVFGVGNPDADLVFVGEAPGRDEDEQGEPFVGAAGQLLTKILGAIGFERDDVYICNVLKCRPPQNRDPERDEVEACEPYLKRQLDILQPQLICCLGRHAAHTLLGTTASLKSMRGHVQDYYGIPTVVTYHPAALLRNPQWKRPTWEDVQKLRAMYDRLTA